MKLLNFKKIFVYSLLKIGKFKKLCVVTSTLYCLPLINKVIKVLKCIYVADWIMNRIIKPFNLENLNIILKISKQLLKMLHVDII